jgi:hypothetical protein
MNHMMSKVVASVCLIVLLAGCGGDNSAGGPIQTGNEVVGSYWGRVENTSGDRARLTLTIESVDMFGGISGSVKLDGSPACFTSAIFSGETYDRNGRTGIIHAEGSDSARAMLSFSFSSEKKQLIIEGGISKFENGQGVSCFVLKSALLNDGPPER